MLNEFQDCKWKTEKMGVPGGVGFGLWGQPLSPAHCFVCAEPEGRQQEPRHRLHSSQRTEQPQPRPGVHQASRVTGEQQQHLPHTPGGPGRCVFCQPSHELPEPHHRVFPQTDESSMFQTEKSGPPRTNPSSPVQGMAGTARLLSLLAASQVDMSCTHTWASQHIAADMMTGVM